MEERTISLEGLKKIEKAEYHIIEELTDLIIDYKHEGRIAAAASVEESLKWQRGRWAMICDLIESVEK